MIWLIFIALFAAGNSEFFEMVEQRQAQGCDWHYVGRTEVTNEISLPAVEQDGTKVYYWHICEK
jgi:hypothetical protein